VTRAAGDGGPGLLRPASKACRRGANSGSSCGEVEIFTGNGDGTFVAASTKIIMTDEAEYVAVGDLKGNGLQDIAWEFEERVHFPGLNRLRKNSFCFCLLADLICLCVETIFIKVLYSVM
jgi:hypothetical protein